MSKTTPQAANEPIYTKGNWFYRGDERFLIKGISYIPRTPNSDSRGPASKIDPLSDDRIDDLRRDIAIFQDLGLNAIQISALDPEKHHSKAMNFLAEAGIYVLVTLLDDLKGPDHTKEVGPDLDITGYYTADLLRPVLKIVDEMAIYPNLLAFVIGTDAIDRSAVSKLAELYRAVVRDVKTWLCERRGRVPPIGVSVNDIGNLKRAMLAYFTAGPSHQRVDFFAMDSWTWAYKSSFEISGWKNMVEVYGKYPVPMYLSAFGTYAGKKRLWEEIGCLYSPDMTGVFSGGCVYTYFDSGDWYGIVRATGQEVKRKHEYVRLRVQFETVNGREQDAVFTSECKDYEGWEGAFPEMSQRWLAKSVLPQLPGGLENLTQELKDEKEWDLVELNEALKQAI